MEHLSLDAIEGGLARLVGPDGTERLVAAEQLPPEACPGDLLLWEETQGRYRVDAEATQARRQALRQRRHRLLRRPE